MLKKYSILQNDVKVALFKVALMSFFLFFSFLSFGKDYCNGDEVKNDKPAIIFVAEGAKLYSENEGVIHNAEIIEEDQTKNKIFISEGTIVYSNDPNSNVKNVKLQNPERNYNKKKNPLPDKNEAVKKIIAAVKKLVSEHYENKPFQNSSLFSNKTNDISFFLQPTSQIYLFTVHTLPFEFQNILKKISNQKIIYKNPIIATRYFNGKHSVRPPTSFS